MKKKETNYIKVTKDLNGVMDRVAERLYRDWSESPVPSLVKSQQWISKTIQEILFPIDLPSAVIKYREPKLQMKKWGPMGDVSYSAPEGKQDYGRRRPKKSQVPTMKQLKQQERMRKTLDAWRDLEPNLQKRWKFVKIDSNKRGVHLFRGIYLSMLRDNKPIPNPLLPTTEILKYYLTRKT